MPTRDPQLIVDGFGALDAGTNSGIAPQLLERNQTSFSTNISYRGGYARNRPGFKLVTLNFGGDVGLEQRFSQGLWQGAAFFRSEYGEEGDVVSISGRIYFLVDKGAIREVRDVTPLTGGPDDPNSSGNAIAWLWQSERWMIINDGEKYPIFFDGQLSRRSRGPSQVVGTLAVGFVAPAIGASIGVTLTAPYTGPINENVFIGNAFYQVNASGAGYTITLKKLADYGLQTGAPLPADSQLQFPTNMAGQLSQNEVGVLIGRTVDHNTGVPQDVYGIALNFITPPSPPIIAGVIPASNLIPNPNPGELLTGVISTSNVGQVNVYATGRALSKSGTNYISNSQTNIPNQFSTAAINSPVYRGYPQFTAPLGMTLASAFTMPPIGGSADAIIKVPYNGPIPAFVTIAGNLFEITATNNTPIPSASIDITNVNDTPGTVRAAGVTLDTIPELSIGRMGAYVRGRNWYSLPDGRSYRASDIVGGSSGSPAVNSRDAVLKETENTYLFGGGDFVIPGNTGDIRAIWATADLDVSLGQGPLMIGTSKMIVSCQAPVDRTTWQAVTNPIQTVSLIGKGPLGQYGTILVNSDTIFRAIDGLASLILARRDFDKWGNVPISREVQRVIDEDKDSLLQNATAMQFDNRLLMGCLPVQGPLGVFHQGMIVINFDPVSSLRGKGDSIYDGFWTGVNTLQFVTGTYAGTDRAFSYTFNSFLQKIEVFELLPSSKENNFDNQGIPITCSFESASLFKDVKGKGLFEFVELLDGEIFLSDIRGVVNVQTWWKPSFSDCWFPWHAFNICFDNSNELHPKGYRVPLGLGRPDSKLCDPNTGKPANIFINFQFRAQITGACVVKGALFKAKLSPEPQWSQPVCYELCSIEDASVV